MISRMFEVNYVTIPTAKAKKQELCLFNHILPSYELLKEQNTSRRKKWNNFSLGKTQRYYVFGCIYIFFHFFLFFLPSTAVRNDDFYRCNFGASKRKKYEKYRTRKNKSCIEHFKFDDGAWFL